MIDIAELTDTNMLKLPAELARQFHVSDRFVVWVSGDTLHLKRITSPAVTDIVAQAPEEVPLSLPIRIKLSSSLRSSGVIEPGVSIPGVRTSRADPP